MRNRIVGAGLVALMIGAAVSVVAFWPIDQSEAADHLDPTNRTGLMADPRFGSEDIGDLYVWHTADSVVAVLTFNGPVPAADGDAVGCDPDSLYTMHFDTDDDAVSDLDVEFRFGADDVGNCFVQATNVPGAGGAVITAPVDRVSTRNGVSLFAGYRDDPFFFDLMGFTDTLDTETLAFVSDRDFFAMQNISTIVIEVPLASVSATGGAFRAWATTAKFGG